MTKATFPLTLDNARAMQAFFIGIEDERVRAGLKAQADVPADVLQVVEMVEDEEFLSRATDIVTAMRGSSARSLARADAPVKLTAPSAQVDFDKTEISMLRDQGRALNEYLEGKYPQGVALLKSYAEASLGKQVTYQGWTAVNADAVANAEAVANAVVYANVAVATMAVVAAAAVAVIAAVVA